MDLFNDNQPGNELKQLLMTLKTEFEEIRTNLDKTDEFELEARNVIDDIKARSNKILFIIDKFESVVNDSNILSSIGSDNMIGSIDIGGGGGHHAKCLSIAKELRLMPQVSESGSVIQAQLALDGGGRSLSINLGGYGNDSTATTNDIIDNGANSHHAISISNNQSNKSAPTGSRTSHKYGNHLSRPSQNAILMSEDGTSFAPSVIVTSVADDSDIWICPKYELSLIEDALNLNNEDDEDEDDGGRVYKSLSQYKRECWNYMLKAKDLREQEFDEFWEKQVDFAQQIKEMVNVKCDITDELESFKYKAIETELISKNEINQLKISKCTLVQTTSKEIEHLRNIIKLLSKNNRIRNDNNNNDNALTNKRNHSI